MAAFYEQGKYRIQITEQVMGENKNGNPQLILKFKPIAIYGDDGEPSKYIGPYDRTIYLTFTEKTLGTDSNPGWVLKTLEYLGFNGTSFAQLDLSHKDAVSFVGVECEAGCKHEEFEGKERETWNIIRPGGGDTGKPLEKKALRALDARFGKLLKKTVGAAPARKPEGEGDGDTATATMDPLPPMDPPPPGRSEEDIPF